MTFPFYTIGHSNLPVRAFIDTLLDAEISIVVDVRKIPQSLANPQFNEESLSEALETYGISYEHLPALGGLRGKQRLVAPNINAYWQNRSSATMPTMRYPKASVREYNG